MALYDRATGAHTTEPNYGGGALTFLYKTVPGRVLLKYVAAAPWFSKLQGLYRNTARSAKGIPAFVEKNHIDLSDGTNGPAVYNPDTWTGWAIEDFDSFNGFFARQRDYDKYFAARGTVVDGVHMPAVADARLSVYPITVDLTLTLKNTTYTLNELLGIGTGDRKHYVPPKNLSSYKGGHAFVFRLSVEDYHRYVFPDSGEKVVFYHLPGQLHTVRPVSEKHRVYARNSRTVTVLDTDHFGSMTQVEVGAMLVGHIVNHPVNTFQALQEKGYFEFGGSTIVLLTTPSVMPDEDLLRETEAGNEVKVRMGEPIAQRK